MAEWIAYHSLMDAGLATEDRIRVFLERQLRQARYVPLSDLVWAFPFDAEPYAVGYVAVALLVGARDPLTIRTRCGRVGDGEAWPWPSRPCSGNPSRISTSTSRRTARSTR